MGRVNPKTTESSPPSSALNPGLQEALRDMGRPTTPRDLARRGVRRLRSVGMREISLLIERAVNRTMLERTRNLEPEEFDELVTGAGAEFASQLRQLLQLSDSRQLLSRHQTEWRASLDELRRIVQQRRSYVQERVDAAARPASAESLKLRRDIEECLLKAVPGAARGGRDPSIVWQLSDTLSSLCEARVERELESQRRSLGLDLEGLERLEQRISQVLESLEEAQIALANAAHTRAENLGIASVYKDVQGLEPEERDRELKVALMSTIFEENVKLRQEHAEK